MADELYVEPEDVFRTIAGFRLMPSYYGDELRPPDLGSALASAPLITLASAATDVLTSLTRELSRFADVVTNAMADVIQADVVVCPDSPPQPPERNMIAFWAEHGYAVPDDLQDWVQGDVGVDSYGPDEFCESRDD